MHEWIERSLATVVVLAGLACAAEEADAPGGPDVPAPTGPAATGSTGNPATAAGSTADGVTPMQAAPTGPAAPPANAGGAGAAAPVDPGAPPAPAAAPPPSGPAVEIPGVACGPASTLVWDESNILVPGLENSGFGEPNYQIGGRDVALHYPCKPAGTAVTFILNLHGTMPDQTLKGYQIPYFGVHHLVDSHDLIVVAPRAVGAQWGVFDGGADEPHLLEIVDWVYANFSDFDIESMWVAGHSQGSIYAKGFVCHAALADKVKGVVAQAGGNLNPLCIDRVSHIHTIGELDMGGILPEQSAAAAAHGCNPVISGPHMLGNNRHRYFEGCNGFVHSDYFMLGKGHVETIDDEVVLSIVEEIKSVQ